MSDIIPQDTPESKQCTKCKQVFPATTDYFYPKSKKSPELRATCKKCAQKLNDENSTIRTCPSCKIEKPNTLEFFYSDRKRCKACISDKCKEYVDSHKEQHKEAMRVHRIANRESYRERARQYRKLYPERLRRNHRNYRIRHRERVLARSRELRRLHPEQYQQYFRTYREKYPERIRARARLYRLNNPEKVNTFRRNYYARKKQAQGTHTAQDILLQYKRQRGRCYWCKEKVGKEKHEYHVDHIVPLSRGGSNGPDNLVISCPTCNISRNNKLPHEWPKGGRLL